MPKDTPKSENSGNCLPCATVGEQLSAYLDGELSEADAAAVTAHLTVCPGCAALCDALRRVRDEVADAALTVPATLRPRILAGIRREARLRRIRRMTTAAAGLAACLCLVVVGGAMLRAGTMSTDGAMPEAAGNQAKSIAYAADGDGAALYAADVAEPEMVGATVDTTIVADLTQAATGLEDKAELEGEHLPNDAAPAPTKRGESLEQTESIAQVGALSVTRDGDGWAVSDENGRRLTLGDLLGDIRPESIGASADTRWRPSAEGLVLVLSGGEKTIPWTDPALAGVAARYGIGK